MELNHDIIDTPPRDSASVVMLRDSADGLQVLLMRRHTDSAVLGGAYVFPGGKVDAADSAPEMLALLDRPLAELHARVAEPALSPEQAAAFYVAAAREAAEESGLLYLQVGAAEIAEHSAATCERLRAGESFAALLAEHGARLDTDALAPWVRWITPRRPSVMNKRFDTRFFLAAVPPAISGRDSANLRGDAITGDRYYSQDFAQKDVVALVEVLDVGHADVREKLGEVDFVRVGVVAQGEEKGAVGGGVGGVFGVEGGGGSLGGGL